MVIPCYNAGARLRAVVQRVSALVDHVFVVDDGSTDGAVDDIRDLDVRIISFPKNRGKGAALLAGFRAALALPQIVCVAVVDADGQHDAGEIPKLFDAFLARSADVVIGARTFDRRTVPWPSWLGNKLTVLLTSWLFACQLPDTQSGFRLHGRRFLDDILRTIPEGRYETEMAIVIKAIREKRVLVSVPITTIYEKGNASSHFRRVRDSFRVYRTLLLGVLRK